VRHQQQPPVTRPAPPTLRNTTPPASLAEQRELPTVELARRVVASYNDRDLDAMLSLTHPDAVIRPSRALGSGPYRGHHGVRVWWGSMIAADRWFHAVPFEYRPLDLQQVAIFGELLFDDELMSAWAGLVAFRDGLLTESRFYLTPRTLLEELGIFEV
jgi:ketosteroid isomerase-like protein